MCKACGLAKLNPEPTELQLDQLRRHKESGTVPNLPKWYKAHWRACNSHNYAHAVPRVEKLTACTVRDSLPKTIAPQVLRIPAHPYNNGTTQEYVREFERLNNLKVSP